MVKEEDSNRIKKLIEKIAVARDTGKKLMLDSENSELQGFQRRLKEISDKADLAYNDVVVKKAKLKDASERMQKLEQQLDQLLLEINKFQNSG
jgi:flagellar biosynthesis chaperone FliJ